MYRFQLIYNFIARSLIIILFIYFNNKHPPSYKIISFRSFKFEDFLIKIGLTKRKSFYGGDFINRISFQLMMNGSKSVCLMLA